MYYGNYEKRTVKAPKMNKIKAIIKKILNINKHGIPGYSKPENIHVNNYRTGNYYLK